jgi:hypothetical protein
MLKMLEWFVEVTYPFVLMEEMAIPLVGFKLASITSCGVLSVIHLGAMKMPLLPVRC